MANKINLIIGMILIIGIITAVVIADTITKTDSTISLSKDRTDVLTTKGIANINVKASPMICDSKECWSDIYQANLIQTQFRTQKNYCIKFNTTTTCLRYEQVCLKEDKQDIDNCIEYDSDGKCIKDEITTQTNCLEYGDGDCIENSQPTRECLEYKDYTATELITMRDSFVKKRIEDYTSSLISDNSKSAVNKIDDGGIIISR